MNKSIMHPEQECHESQETPNPKLIEYSRSGLLLTWSGQIPHHRYDRLLHWPLGELENHNMVELRDIACPAGQLNELEMLRPIMQW